MRIEVSDPEEVVKEAFWLAWQASGVFGMGVMQDKPGASKESVWKNISYMGDYPGKHDPQAGRADADYVFGRMMKLRLQWDDRSVSFPDSEPRHDYQSWCGKYRTYKALIDAAIASCKKAAVKGAAQ